MTKFNGLKRTFKSIKDHNKSGNSPRAWPYLQVMDDLLENRPFMAPLSTVCSSGTESEGSRPSSACSEPLSATTSRKRKMEQDVSLISKAITKSREIAELNRQRRYEENMTQRQNLLEKLDKLIDKM
uniref:MADF domain-containing protein n=1 Tax=Photinus pyralis TaxID=7054 RepID=A0A1Y1LA16_PHOPY